MSRDDVYRSGPCHYVPVSLRLLARLTCCGGKKKGGAFAFPVRPSAWNNSPLDVRISVQQFMFGTFIKICRQYSSLVKTGQKYETLHMQTAGNLCMISRWIISDMEKKKRSKYKQRIGYTANSDTSVGLCKEQAVFPRWSAHWIFITWTLYFKELQTDKPRQ
jgi:hypothetical protein